MGLVRGGVGPGSSGRAGPEQHQPAATRTCADEEVGSSADLQLEALVVLLTEALEAEEPEAEEPEAEEPVAAEPFIDLT